MAATWWFQLWSYRSLNAAKWEVIGRLEEQLPAKPFRDEWEILKRDPVERTVLKSKLLGNLIKPLARYPELTIVEQLVPVVFFTLFATSLGRALS